MALPDNLLMLERAARDRLAPDVFDYYAGGAEDEWTLAANRAAFGRWALRPRALVDVATVDTGVELLGARAALPVLIAPMAFQRLAHPDGELATARAAAARGSIMVASTLSTHPIEEITAAVTGPVWLQLYVFRDRSITRELVQRAQQAGCRAICLTVDVPVQGNRERDARNRFSLPAGLEMANFSGLRQARMPAAEDSGLMAFIHREFDPSLDWRTLEWLRSVSELPIVLKGIATAEDGLRAVEHGADAVIVSNHGGRQLDGAEASLDALPHVAEAIGGRIPVLMDGGIRRGTDVIKALALGARAVLVGRPILWALALGGQPGVEHALGILKAELERGLALLGRPRTADIDRSAVTPAPPLPQQQQLC